MPPERTVEQRQSALDRAMQVRRERAQLRQDLKAGRVDPLQVIDQEQYGAVRVTWFLQSLPGIGAARAATMMTELQIADSRRLGGLSDRQRAGLSSRLGA